MAQAGVSRFVQASSMVVYGEGRYTCAVHGAQSPTPRRVEDLDGRQFDNRCPWCAQVLGWETVAEDAVLDPAQQLRREQGGAGALRGRVGRQAAASAISLRYHNVYGPGMPRDTPYSGVAAIFRSAMEAGRAPVVFEDGGQMRDFVHVHDVARANVAAVEAVPGRDQGSHTAYNVCSGEPVTNLDVARMVTAGAPGARAPVVSGTIGSATSDTSSPRRHVPVLSWVHSSSEPVQGLAQFAHDPLRG